MALSCHRAGSLPGTGPHPLLHDGAVQSVAQREAEPQRNMSGNILVTLVPSGVLQRFLDSGPKLSSRDQRTVEAEERPEEAKSVRFACNVIAFTRRDSGAGFQCARVKSADLWRELWERAENCLEGDDGRADVAPAHNGG